MQTTTEIEVLGKDFSGALNRVENYFRSKLDSDGLTTRENCDHGVGTVYQSVMPYAYLNLQ